MIPTFLDLRTGNTAKGSDMSVFWWTEGNGACDCNRAIAFGVGVGSVAEELAAQHPGICYGCKRFVAIDVEGSLEDAPSKEHVLACMNSEYGR
jgi:hypothetical protein